MMIVGHKNYAGVSTHAARSFAEIINTHISDLDPVYVRHGVITEYKDGRCTVHVRSIDNSEHINAEINPEGELTYLETRSFDEDGYTKNVIDHMADTTTTLLATLNTLKDNA